MARTKRTDQPVIAEMVRLPRCKVGRNSLKSYSSTRGSGSGLYILQKSLLRGIVGTMPIHKRVKLGETVSLKLDEHERGLIFNETIAGSNLTDRYVPHQPLH